MVPAGEGGRRHSIAHGSRQGRACARALRGPSTLPLLRAKELPEPRADSSSSGTHGPRKGRVLDPDHRGGRGRASVQYPDNPPAWRSPVTKAEKHLRKVEVAFPDSA